MLWGPRGVRSKYQAVQCSSVKFGRDVGNFIVYLSHGSHRQRSNTPDSGLLARVFAYAAGLQRHPKRSPGHQGQGAEFQASGLSQFGCALILLCKDREAGESNAATHPNCGCQNGLAYLRLIASCRTFGMAQREQARRACWQIALGPFMQKGDPPWITRWKLNTR